MLTSSKNLYVIKTQGNSHKIPKFWNKVLIKLRRAINHSIQEFVEFQVIEAQNWNMDLQKSVDSEH